MPYNKNTRLKLYLLLGAALSLSACASTPAMKHGQSGFGDAVAHNMKAQAIAPTAKQKEDTYIPASPTRRRAARAAYEAGEIKELEPLITTNGSD